MLVTFTTLTWPLREQDEPLSPEYDEQILHIENGIYRAVLRQLFDPDNYNYDPEGRINFELILTRQDTSPSDTEVPPAFIIWNTPESDPEDDYVFISHEENEFDSLIAQFIAEQKEAANNPPQ